MRSVWIFWSLLVNSRGTKIGWVSELVIPPIRFVAWTMLIGRVLSTYTLNKRRWDNKPIIPKKTQQTDLMFSHNRQRLADRIDQHVPKHIITEPEPRKKTRGRPPKERSNPAEGYDSAIACHLAANKTCSRRYEVGDFSVLTRARTKNHLNVLEAVYISVLNPVLCKQKSFVTNLTLFQHTQRTHPP